jgi:N-acetylmuramoyl-L-alanine amidase
MRSSGRALCAVLIVVGTLGTALVAQSIQRQYLDLLARETSLRAELELAPQRRAQPPGEASVALLLRVRSAIAAYENLARRNPQSGYSDNALWQAAVLSADTFWQFGDTRDRAAALTLFARLKATFPTSSLIRKITPYTTRLEGAADSASQTTVTTLTAVRREVLPGVLRITLELEREAAFTEERLEAPERVFVDLRDTLVVGALKDATIPFPDDIVRQARIGRQPDNRTRVVFDLQEPARYSVYSLYNPYRIVIDFEGIDSTPASTAVSPTPETSGEPVSPAPAQVAGTSMTAAPPTSRESAAAANPGERPSTASANASGGFSLSRQLGLGVSRVAIDPGHGGRDPGAEIQGLSEAQIVLDIALELERRLAKYPNVEVVLTRRTDAYVPLAERTAIANTSGADLFLSIHVNASANTAARGIETYFLNFAANPEAEALAARENASAARTMASLPDIVKAIALNNKIDESRDFASIVHAALHERLRTIDRSTKDLGVKQAPFMVLIGATMPSVLVEISFLTNRDEAALLRSDSYRQQVAQALLDGIMNYQRALKRTAVPRSTF